MLMYILRKLTYDGWLQNPAPAKNGGTHLIIHGISTILLVVQDFATIHSILSIFTV